MKETRGNRLHISFFGKMNVGKSSIINALFGREISIVSDTKGTTTDVNQKAMELKPLGAVSILDTAGLDDTGELGKKRVEKTLEAINRTDVAIVVFDKNGVKDCDVELFNTLKEKKIPILSIVNKTDCEKISKEKFNEIAKNSNKVISLSAICDKDIHNKITSGLISILPDEQINPQNILGALIKEGETAVLVIPIDKAAPKRRLILPQVQTIRDLLDNGAMSIICDVQNLKNALDNLKNPPSLVITDSQAFKEVSEIVPNEIKLTSFSIIFAKLKGDLKTFVDGANALEKLNNGDKILICESCSHHPIEDDIGTVKIPNLIKKFTKKDLVFEHASGHKFPQNIEEYALIVHCGACMTNRREVLSRIQIAQSKNVPISNYGVIIAKCLGILERTLEPFEI